MSGRRADPSATSQAAACAPQSNHFSSHGTILVVEDEPAVLGLLQTILQRQGFEVLVAMDSDEARRLWRENLRRIDLLLTDVVLPGTTFGIELGKVFQREKPNLRVMYTSGYSTESLEITEVLPGDWVFIAKPFDARMLLNQVRQLMGLR